MTAQHPAEPATDAAQGAPDLAAGGEGTATGPGRREVLRGAAALGVAGAGVAGLSACSTTAGGGKDHSAFKATGPVTVGKAVDVPVGKGKVYGDTGVVVTQPQAGDYRAFDAACPHQGCLVTKVDQGVVHCPCHGSQFSSADGSVVRRPATKGLKPLPVTVTDGNLVVG